MTFSGGQNKEKGGAVEGVAPGSSKADSLQQMQEAIRQVQNFSQQEQNLIKQEGQGEKRADPEMLAKIARELPRVIQRVLQKIEASQVYQTFKLPGSHYVVHDRREKGADARGPEREKGEKIREESKMSLEALLLRKGKLQGAKEKGYENYLADPASRIKTPPVQTQTESKLAKLLSRFEQILLKRFEEGSKVAKEAQDGRFFFLKKTAEQWRNFFGHFVKRTVKRRVSVDHIEGWVYRGLVRKNARATVISDLAFVNGQIEKFARFRLSPAGQNLANRLQQMEPGVRIAGSELKELTAEEMEYLAIQHAESDAGWIWAPTQGKFLKTAQVEEKVAGDLGLLAEGDKKEKALKGLKKRRGGGLGWEEGPSEEPGSRFVPWYQTALQKKPGGPVRWFVVVSYCTAVALAVLGLLYLARM